MARVLALIPTDLGSVSLSAFEADRRARSEYAELVRGLNQSAGDRADFVDYTAISGGRGFFWALVARILGPAIAMAGFAFRHASAYDVIFSGGEPVGVPLALLLMLRRTRPRHVVLALDPTRWKTDLAFRWFGLARAVDTLIVHSRALLDHSVRGLGIPADRVILMRNHVDARFYRPIPAAQSHRLRLCAAGFARRDYDTLVKAVAQLPDVTLTVDPSGHPLRLARRCLPTVPVPENATFVSFPPGGLRDLYGPSDVVCVPLHDGASTCGVTTLLEGMAMGKPVVVTGTIGLDDLIADGETGFKVAPGDVDGWVAAIRRLRDDPLLRARMGENARHWVMQNATIELWSDTIRAAIGRTATRNIQDCGPTPVPGEVSARAKVR